MVRKQRHFGRSKINAQSMPATVALTVLPPDLGMWKCINRIPAGAVVKEQFFVDKSYH